MNTSLTNRQKEIFKFIRQQIDEAGYPPSVREIGKAVGLSSSSTVHAHLRTLQKKGLLEIDDSKTRAIRLPGRHLKAVETQPAPSNVVSLPVLGRVAAGEPIFAEQNIDDYVDVPQNMARGNDLFVLDVQGDSMIGVGIMPRDKIIVRSQQTAENGEIVVALLDDEATVKRFCKEKDYIVLKAENPEYAPIISRYVQVIGKVVGLLRTY